MKFIKTAALASILALSTSTAVLAQVADPARPDKGSPGGSNAATSTENTKTGGIAGSNTSVNDPASPDRMGATGRSDAAKSDSGERRTGGIAGQNTRINDPASPDRMGAQPWRGEDRRDRRGDDRRDSYAGDISPRDAARIAARNGVDDVDDVRFTRGSYTVTGFDRRGYELHVRIDRDGDVIDIDRR